jgi:hypothetical protein
MAPDTRNYLQVRFPLENPIIVYTLYGLMFIIAVGWTVYTTAEITFALCGDDSWPSAVFLSALVLWCMKTTWCYFDQGAEWERDYEFDDE